MSKGPVSRRRADAAIADAWKGFYATPEGRAAIAELMVWCNLYQPCVSNDVMEMAREQGERNVALRIVQMIGLKPAEAPVDAWEDADILDRMIGNIK